MELTRISIEQIAKRIQVIWEIQKRVLESLGISYSDTLAQELKSQLEAHVPPDCWKLLESYPNVSLRDLKERQRAELATARTRSLNKAFAEIDLCVDGLRTSSATAVQQESKEKEQDFGILLSRGQAAKDFETWIRELDHPGAQIALLFIDLDYFKLLNTKHSHSRIDQTILPEAMHLLRNLVRSRGEAYRYGGEEFLICLPNHDLPEATNFAEKVRSTFEQHRFRVDNYTEQVTVSIGFALWPQHGTHYEEVKQVANDAEGIAKQRRNCFVLADITSMKGTPLPKSGLSDLAQRLVALLSEKSQNGVEHDPIMDAVVLGEAMGVSQEALGVAADELSERKWVVLDKLVGMGKAGFSKLWPTPRLFIEIDPHLKQWNPRVDAKTVASFLLKQSDESAFLSDIDKQLAWGPRRINPATAHLVLNDYVQSYTALGASPYAYTWIRGTPKTRRFAQEA